MLGSVSIESIDMFSHVHCSILIPVAVGSYNEDGYMKAITGLGGIISTSLVPLWFVHNCIS